jgi:hypothetical protein
MPVVVTQADRESFLRCRRQWDLRARMRRSLEPVRAPAGPDLAAAVRAALAVYYFPGMWDWDRAITIPLVRQGFDRDISRQRERRPPGEPAPDWTRQLADGHDLLDCYFAWAPGVDRFSPVLIDSDYDVQLLDPGRPGSGLTGPGGQPVRFRGRIHLLAVDQYDAYWLVRHTVPTGGWPDTGELMRDAAALADAWAWEQFYPGMVIAGTIYNELRLSALPVPESAEARPARADGRSRWLRRRPRPAPGSAAQPLVRQHEPSGGGRSIPQHRRMDARAREPAAAAPAEEAGPGERTSIVAQTSTGGFRRTWIRHSPAVVAAAGQRLGADAAAMLGAGPSAAPNPSDANCRPCEFLQPCLAMRAGRDSEFLLRSGYRTRPPDVPEEGRLGGSSWGTGRGAAPFRGGS